MSNNIVPLFILIAALVVIVALFGWLSAQKRKKELLAWAQSRGLQFEDGKAYGLDDRFPEFQCLRNGSNRYAQNTMAGIWNRRPVVAFDYHYETHSTDSKGNRETTHHYFSAVLIESKVPLKPLLIRHEGLLDKIADFLGFEDIHFESAEFSRKFHVKSADRKWAYDVIQPKTMELLLDMPTFTIQFGPRQVMAHRDSTFKVEEFGAAAEVASGMLDNLPQYVVEQQEQS